MRCDQGHEHEGLDAALLQHAVGVFRGRAVPFHPQTPAYRSSARGRVRLPDGLASRRNTRTRMAQCRFSGGRSKARSGRDEEW